MVVGLPPGLRLWAADRQIDAGSTGDQQYGCERHADLALSRSEGIAPVAQQVGGRAADDEVDLNAMLGVEERYARPDALVHQTARRLSVWPSKPI
jgi:hypothetical protein